jgi:hypothetical protein
LQNITVSVTWLISKIFKLEPFLECEKGWNFSNIEIKGIPCPYSRRKNEFWYDGSLFAG